MIPIITDRLILRNFKISDWEDLRETILQYQSSDMADYDQPWPTSPEEIKGIAEWFASRSDYLAVCLKDSGQFIGFVGLSPDLNGDYNLGPVQCFSPQMQIKAHQGYVLPEKQLHDLNLLHNKFMI
jgi:RimJ/RimL family protein N-acetyltransferase